MSNLKSHNRIISNLDTSRLKEQLMQNMHLFGQIPYRKWGDDCPHKEMTDIWLRYGSIGDFERTGNTDVFKKEHQPVWYESIKILTHAVPLIRAVCDEVRSNEVGMVLITKLEPGGQIKPHVDSGWHADYFDKYYIPIYNKSGSSFYFEDGVIKDPIEGDVWAFDNSVTHWVRNDSTDMRIAMIICVKQSKYDRGGNLCQHQ